MVNKCYQTILFKALAATCVWCSWSTHLVALEQSKKLAMQDKTIKPPNYQNVKRVPFERVREKARSVPIEKIERIEFIFRLYDDKRGNRNELMQPKIVRVVSRKEIKEIIGAFLKATVPDVGGDPEGIAEPPDYIKVYAYGGKKPAFGFRFVEFEYGSIADGWGEEVARVYTKYRKLAFSRKKA